MKAAEKNKVTPAELIKTPLQIVEENAEKRKIELQETLKTKIHVFCFHLPNTTSAIAYLREPSFQVKKMAMDMSLRSITSASELVLDSCIIKEESDERIWGENAEEENPELRLGAIMRTQEIVVYYVDSLKKK